MFFIAIKPLSGLRLIKTAQNITESLVTLARLASLNSNHNDDDETVP